MQSRRRPLFVGFALALASASATASPSPSKVGDAERVARAAEPAEIAEVACDPRAWPALGSRAAPVTVQLFADPSQRYALQMWLEARALVAERPGEVRVELVPSPSEPSADLSARQRELHRWIHVVIALGGAEQVLRAVDRLGDAVIQDRLFAPTRRRALAAEFGVDADAIEHELSGSRLRCIDARIDAASDDLRRASATVLGRSRPPLVAIAPDDRPRLVYADGERLSELRGRIGDLLAKPVPVATTAIPALPGDGDPLSFDRTFDDLGILLGGAGLPHRLLILADGENESRLLGVLGPGLAFAAQRPGELSVQVVAVGNGEPALELRRRLCAARSLGLEGEYLRYLAHAPERRNAITKTTHLTKLLDEPKGGDACDDEEPRVDGRGDSSKARLDAPPDHPRTPTPHGAWLDGRPVGPGEMEALELRFWGRRGPSVLDWLWRADSDEE